MIERGKKVFNNVKASLAAGLVVTVLLAGCSTPASLPPKVSAGLNGLQIEKTVGALKDLMSKPQADYSSQFESFSHELDILKEKVEQARQQRVTTETVVEEQFLTWDENLKELKNEESRALAAGRRAATEATYSEIQQKIAELRKVGKPFMTDLTDTRLYLKDDLSKEGLQTMTPTVERIYERKSQVIDRLDAVIEALNNAMKRS
jgi:TolA-binding protein